MNIPPQSQQVYKYPSMTSVNTMASLGYLPPGHGYVPKKEKPEKPYGLPFTTVMNRTHRGPGRKHLRYALAFAIAAILFFAGAALYLGHRNVSRMIVYRTEVLGAFMVVVGILCVYMMGNCIWKARKESNKWRNGVRFRPEGLSTAAAFNAAYVPEDVVGEKLSSGTYGPKALKEIPKPKRGKGMAPRQGPRQAPAPAPAPVPQGPMNTVDEVDEADEVVLTSKEAGLPQPPPSQPQAMPPPGGPRPPYRPGGPPPPGGFRPRGPPPPGWRGPPPPGFRPRGPPPPGWRPPPPGWRGPRPGGIPPQPLRDPPMGPGPHPLQEMRAGGGQPAQYIPIGGVPPRESESDL